MIALPLLSLIDLMLRMLVLGQLLLMGCLLWRSPPSLLRHLLFAAGVSVAGLILLTAPIEEAHYGLLRNVLLLLTDAFAFIFWLLIRHQFDDDFRPGQWPRTIKLGLGLFAMLYFYALGIKSGITPIHDLIHGLGLLLIVHAAWVAARGFADDLLDTRRRARILVVLVIALYSTILVIFEFADERFRNAAWFGVINAAVLLMAISVGSVRLFRLRFEPVDRTKPADSLTPDTHSDADTSPELSAADARLAAALDQFIADKRYHQNGLTINALAEQLDCPAHRLRKLINQRRGYRNFNSLLNDLRIADAMVRLADPAYDELPILSLALDLGYDSIGPFNRAFKAQTGQTPGDYRRSF